MSEIAKTFTAAFETVKEHIRYFKSKPDADAAYNGRIVGMEDALSQFRPVMKMIERAALSQPSVTVLVEARDAIIEARRNIDAVDNALADAFMWDALARLNTIIGEK